MKLALPFDPRFMNQEMSKNLSKTDMKPTTRRTQLQRTELSDQLMLDAAQELILEVGTARTTLKEIGERAGYSRGLANARFGSREVLFIRLANRSRRQWLATLSQAQGQKTGLAALESRLDAILDYLERHPNEARVMYILWFEAVGAPSEINSSLSRFHKQAREDILQLVQEAGLIPSGADDGWGHRYAARFVGVIFGLCYQWLVNPDAVDFNKHMAELKAELHEARN